MVLEQGALAHLFERLGIDYSIEADQTLEEACAKKGLDFDSVLLDIRTLESTRSYSFLHCDLWDVEFLIEYIVENHHRYLKETIPILAAQLRKLIAAQGDEYPYLRPVSMLFEGSAHEFEQHMRKEEMILFPYLKSLASAKEFSRRRPMAPFHSVESPLKKMEEEHRETAQVLNRIRGLLSDFKVPHGATPMHHAVIKGLQALIKDLHQHIHLENNMLFPRARALEKYFANGPTEPYPEETHSLHQ